MIATLRRRSTLVLRFALVAVVALSISACGDDSDGELDSEESTPATDSADGSAASAAEVRSVDDVAADLAAVGLCTDPTPGDAEVEALGGLVPTGVIRCTTDTGSRVTVFAYPDADDAGEARSVVFDYVPCGFDGADAFALLVAGNTVVQIDSAVNSEGRAIAQPDEGALTTAQGTLGGDVEHPDC